MRVADVIRAKARERLAAADAPAAGRRSKRVLEDALNAERTAAALGVSLAAPKPKAKPKKKKTPILVTVLAVGPNGEGLAHTYEDRKGPRRLNGVTDLF